MFGEITKYSKIWLITGLLIKAIFALSVLVLVFGITFGDGGRFSIEWAPGVQYERTE